MIIKSKIQNPKSKNGFTLIELIVVIAIIAVLSGIILFSVMQYISKGKDSNIAGNLSVLVPAGEVYYNGNSYSYRYFCDPEQNSVFANAISQMPANAAGACHAANDAGVCCYVDSANYQAWAACATEFANSNFAYCVDSRGVKKEIANSDCVADIFKCP